MAVTNQPWDGSASRYASAVKYCAACLVDVNDGTKTKSMCMLPVREPTGEINSNACHAAAAALGGARNTSIPDGAKVSAAKQLLALYRGELKETPPDSLVALADK